MKSNFLVTGLIAASLLSLQSSPASAHGYHHGGRDAWIGLGIVGATVAAVATIVTLPVRVVADAVTEPAPAPGYAPQPVAAYPSNGYYGNGYPPRPVVYAYPQGYAYQPAPAYYYPAYQ